MVKPRVCSLFLLIPLFNSRPASVNHTKLQMFFFFFLIIIIIFLSRLCQYYYVVPREILPSTFSFGYCYLVILLMTTITLGFLFKFNGGYQSDEM